LLVISPGTVWLYSISCRIVGLTKYLAVQSWMQNTCRVACTWTIYPGWLADYTLATVVNFQQTSNDCLVFVCKCRRVVSSRLIQFVRQVERISWAAPRHLPRSERASDSHAMNGRQWESRRISDRSLTGEQQTSLYVRPSVARWRFARSRPLLLRNASPDFRRAPLKARIERCNWTELNWHGVCSFWRTDQ